MQIKKIVVIGPESTGKSTLCQALAAAFDEPLVQEFARSYLDRLDRDYKYEDLLEIAKGQVQEEESKVKDAKNVLFIDTDLNVLQVWSQHKYGKTDPWILEQIAAQKYDFYLLTDVDIPWEDDPQREYPDPKMRAYFFNWYKKIVEDSGVPFAIIKGGYEARFIQASNVVRGILPSQDFVKEP